MPNDIISWGTVALVLATVALVVVTFFLARYTRWYVTLTYRLSEETKQARQDSYRPILVPEDGIWTIRNAYAPMRYEVVTQSVQNVGSGPALNISIRLEGPRLNTETGKYKRCLVFDEGYAHNLSASQKCEMMTYGAFPGKPIEALDVRVEHEDVLTFWYDDIFGRHFLSSYQCIERRWRSLEHRQIQQRPVASLPNIGV